MEAKSFEQKVLGYAGKLVEKEKEKYSVGMGNSYFTYEDAYKDLEDFLTYGSQLRAENARLKLEIKELTDRLYGRK